MLSLKWTKSLSKLPLCVPPETCGDTYMVNAAAVSDDGSTVIGGTYYQNYLGTTRKRSDGRFGVYCFATAGGGTPIFTNEYDGDQGIYAVAISGDGAIAAGGGLLNLESANPFMSQRGLLRAFDVATHKLLLDTANFSDRINAIALSRDGAVLVAVADMRVYVYLRGANGNFTTPPQSIGLNAYSETLALHPSGTWFAAADQKGGIYVVPITGGVVGTPTTWVTEEPEDPTMAASTKVPVQFHSVAISRQSDAIVAGGDDFVYYFTKPSLAAGGPIARFSSFDANRHHEVRWVAIADDASFVTATINPTKGKTDGRVVKLSPAGPLLNKDWEAVLPHPPNSTSIDGGGTLITVTTGYPNHAAGSLHLFDDAGTPLGMHTTVDMNWPMQVSADGTAIVAGCDDNTLLFFTP